MKILLVQDTDWIAGDDSVLFTISREIATQLRESLPDVFKGTHLLTNYLTRRASRRKGVSLVIQFTGSRYRSSNTGV